MRPHQSRPLGFAACALASSLWGTGFFFGKIALAEMSVGHMVFYRFFFATLALIPIMAIHHPELNWKEWRLLLIASFLGVPLQFLIQFQGLKLTTVSHASLMVGTMPVILAVGATLYAHERLHRIGWAALAASTTGAALIALGRTPTAGASLTGDALVVLSLLIALFWILFNHRLMHRHSSLVITAYGIAVGFLMLCLWVPLQYGPPPIHGVSLKAWLALIASGVLCTATTTQLWNWGMTQVPASQAGIFLNLEPLMGSLLGILVLGERLASIAWLGAALILAAAITLTTTRQPHSDEQPSLIQ